MPESENDAGANITDLSKPLRWTKEEITALRERLGVTQLQMANLIGVSISQYNRWERGHSKPQRLAKGALDWLRKCSTDEIRQAVAEALGVEPSELRQPDRLSSEPGGRFLIKSGRKPGYIQKTRDAV